MLDKISQGYLDEHQPHGWMIEGELYAVSNSKKRPGYWMSCACGWRGWMPEEANDVIVETINRR
jgi:hypothetical protein